jgi:uncharacterized membrane protein
MMMKRLGRSRVVSVAILIAASMCGPAQARAQSVVRAVLFFSPTCPHCHQVINEDLPVIFEQFGGPARVWVNETVPQAERAFYLVTNGQVEVLLIDASRPAGGVLYDQTSQRYLVPPERMGVPRLMAGDTILVGSVEIPTQFPEIIEQGIASGGLEWPAIDGLLDQIPAAPLPAEPTGPEAPAAEPDSTSPSAAPQVKAPSDTVGAESTADRFPPAEANTDSDLPASGSTQAVADPADRSMESTLDAVPSGGGTVSERFSRDPVGNGLSVLVLLVMLMSVYAVFARAPGWQARETASALMPVLATAGLAVAGYLTYVEASGAAAVCGPVGDCNAVQQSSFARLFGVPVGMLGLAGYAAIMLTWIVGRGRARLAPWSTLAQFVMVFVGVLYSSYLTFLEPFVIGATCLWCLSSAAIMTAMLWLVAGPGFRALASLRGS